MVIVLITQENKIKGPFLFMSPGCLVRELEQEGDKKMEKVLTQLEDPEIKVSDEQVWESVPGLRMQLSP